MSIVVRFPPVPGATAEQYDEAVRRIQESGDFPPDGLELHIAFGPESELRSVRSGTRASSSRRSAND